MQYATVFAALAASAAAQDFLSRLNAPGNTPAGCSQSYNGLFEITVVKAAGSKAKRQNNDLILSLQNGIITEQRNKTAGYVASNYQFQFGPPQAGELYNAGFSVCQNGTLAHGDSAIWYECNSGAFNNLYDRHWAAQCDPIFFQIIPTGGSAAPATLTVQSTGASAGVATATKVSATTASFVTGIADGQPQAPTKPVTRASTQIAVTQISDGQPQGPTKIPVISQISDGQPQAPTGRPVSQIGDGQPQAATSVPKNATATGSTPRFTGAASSLQAGSAFAVVFGAVAAAFL